jgi:hypothetical protein
VQMAVPCDVRSQMHHDKARSRHEMSMTDTACADCILYLKSSDIEHVIWTALSIPSVRYHLGNALRMQAS